MGIAVGAPDGPLEVSRQKGPQDLSSRRSMEGSLEDHDGLEAAVVKCKGSGGVGLGWRQSDLRVPFPALVWMETEDGVRGRNNGSLRTSLLVLEKSGPPKRRKDGCCQGKRTDHGKETESRKDEKFWSKKQHKLEGWSQGESDAWILVPGGGGGGV